jgi:O-antigen ligase
MFGVALLALTNKEPYYFIAVCGYIVAAEVPWRVTEAFFLYEFSKYALIVLLPIALLRYSRLLQTDGWAIIFFVLLIPGILIRPFFDRTAIIFNLSGPLILALSVMFLAGLEFNWNQLRRLLFFMAAPMVLQVVWSVTMARGFLASGQIRFGNDSNPWLAGGEGPNQVSTILGLGAALCLLYVVTQQQEHRLRLVLFACTIAFFTQAVATFSRGGVVTAIGTLLVAGYYLIRIPRIRSYYVIGAVIAGAIFVLLIFPALNELTQGTLGVRATSLTLTGRDTIAQSNIQFFLDNPIFGIGVGATDELSGTPHTEFTRMLAEHGLFGLAAIGVLLIMTLQRVLSRQPVLSKAFAVALTAWAIATTLHAATRLAAVGFVFGLGAMYFNLAEQAPPDDTSGQGSDYADNGVSEAETRMFNDY